MAKRNVAGSFEGKPAYRWTKMVDGQRWRLLCRARKEGEQKERTGWLGLPEEQWTEAKSQDAANKWWDEHTANSPRLASLIKGDSTGWLQDLFRQSPEMAKAMDRNPKILDYLERDQKIDRVLARAGIPREVIDVSSIRQNIDQIQEPERTPQNATVGYWRDTYLKSKRTDGGRKTGRFDNLRRSIRKLVASIGEDQPVTALGWEAWDKFTSGLKLAESTKRDTISDCREFCRYLERRKIIPEVGNKMETKSKVRSKAIQHFTLEELKDLHSTAEGMLRTFFLLFMNCGFRQIDVATLTPQMVKNGYIIRQRAKTEGSDAPTVAWKLWPETLAAINKYGSKSGLLFQYEPGRTWVLESSGNDGQRKRDDVYRRELWKPFAKIHKPRLTSDAIRASCANLLKTDSDHTNQLSVQIKYLGQAPSGVALKHYIDPTQQELDDAVMFLHSRLFG